MPNLLAFLAFAAVGAALAWGLLTFFQRSQRRHFNCIAPYVTAEERGALTAHKNP